LNELADAYNEALLYLSHEFAQRPLLESIAVHFAFNFSTDRPTNRLDKPEWFLNFLLQMVRLHGNFILKFFGQGSSQVLFTFLNGLEDIAAEHLKERLQVIVKDEQLLEHYMEACTCFVKEVSDLYNGRTSKLMAIFFRNDQFFALWLQTQQRTARSEYEKLAEDSWSDNVEAFISFFEHYLTKLELIPDSEAAEQYLDNPLIALLEAFVETLEFDVPPFQPNSPEELRSLVKMINAAHVLLKRMQTDWDDRLLVVSSSILPLKPYCLSLKDSQEQLVDKIEQYIWQRISIPLSSFSRAMYYGIYGRSYETMHDDLCLALLQLSESINLVRSLALEEDYEQSIDSKLLLRLGKTFYETVALKNLYSAEGAQRFKRDLQQIVPILTELFPQHDPAFYLKNSIEAASLLCAKDRKRISLLVSAADDDDKGLQELSDLFSSIGIKNLTLSDCEQILSLYRSE